MNTVRVASYEPRGDILERLHIKYKANSTQYKSYVNKEIGTRRLVHNKRMFIISEFIISDPIYPVKEGSCILSYDVKLLFGM